MSGDTQALRLQDDDGGQQQSRTLLNRVALCLKLATIHDLSNAALVQPVAQLIATVNEALRDHQSLRLQTVGESIFLNNEMVKLNYATYESATSLRKVYTRLEISEISFLAQLDEDELRRFLQAFQTHYRSKTPQALHDEGP